MKHYNIPIFIPEEACPFQCIFCNQAKISGRQLLPTHEEIASTIERNLSTIGGCGSEVEIAFFGGTFTGISIEKQEEYLSLANRYFGKAVTGIRVSTRPDYINSDIIKLLRKYNVTTVELGAQSMDDSVLLKSGRGHTAGDTCRAAEIIKGAGIKLGLQMMVGLPGDSLESDIYTARKIVELGADNTRIYPAVVIRDTALHKLYTKGKYTPLSLKEAVERTKVLLKIFESGGVKVLRVGLHPSEGLLSGEELVDGPFHISYKELVLTSMWGDILSEIKDAEGGIVVEVPSSEINYAVGYGSVNKKMLLNRFRSVKFKISGELPSGNFNVIYC